MNRVWRFEKLGFLSTNQMMDIAKFSELPVDELLKLIESSDVNGVIGFFKNLTQEYGTIELLPKEVGDIRHVRERNPALSYDR